MKTIFTSEAVTNGHPDKVCDQVADAILDALLEQDPDSRCACEVTAASSHVHVFGEITTQAKINVEDIVRDTIRKIGYTRPELGFDADSIQVDIDLHQQSPDIAMGITRRSSLETLDDGAGDQGMMFGYACSQTPALMPLPIELAQALCKKLEHVRTSGTLPYLRPDGKAQVSVEYDDGKPMRVSTIVLSAQHEEDIPIASLRNDLIQYVIDPVIPARYIDGNTQIFINPTGRFVLGGPAADSGLTGRKLMVDSYGGYARHGGGALCGKDPSKVDRSAAYMARYIAKNIVAAHLASECEVQLGYAIGLAEPVSVNIDTFGTERVPHETLAKAVTDCVDMRPAAIIQRFALKEPIYSQTACYGHFGSNGADMPWERLDLADQLVLNCYGRR